MTQNNQLNSPEPIAIAKGGTGVGSVTTAPTATSWAGWDANKNMSATGFIPGYTTTVTSASPVTLTVGSNQQQYFTGSTAQTLVMPVANTLVTGQYWSVINNSSASMTINSSGGNLILTLPAASETVVTCVLASGTTAASWTTSPAVSGSGTVNSGTQYNIAYYAVSGTAVSGLTNGSAGQIMRYGTPPAWSTATYPATAGSSGNILTSDGTNWNSSAAPAAGVYTLIQSQDASSSATLDFKTGITSTYRTLKFFISQLLPGTASVHLRVQCSTDGGSTWLGTNEYNWNVFTTGATSANANNQAQILLTKSLIPSGANKFASYEINFVMPVTSGDMYYYGLGAAYTDTGQAFAGVTCAGFITANSINAFRFLYSSGNIASGNISLYGIT